MNGALDDLAGGSQSLPEREILLLIKRAKLPMPDRQTVRGEGGLRRYLDLYWDSLRLVVEIDGRFHAAYQQWVADMSRANALVGSGDVVLRFPAWLVRNRPEQVIDQLRSALLARGWQPQPALRGAFNR